MNRPRIVLDTNVLVSAALKPVSQPALAISLIAFRAVELCVSAEVLAEYREVFSRPKLHHLVKEEVSYMLALIEREALMVMPTERLTISKHDSDNRFYECADAGRADFIVTGNFKHFTQPYKTTRIITIRELLEMFTK